LPDTDPVPTTCQPAPHDVGAFACGPYTLKVTVPPGEDPPESTAESADGGIATPSVPDDGTLNDVDVGVDALTTVSAIPAPHAECAPELPASPL
jgi:hypothetical protein